MTKNLLRKIKMRRYNNSSKRLKNQKLIQIIKRRPRIQLTSSKMEKVMPRRMIPKKRRPQMLLKRRRTRRKRSEAHLV